MLDGRFVTLMVDLLLDGRFVLLYVKKEVIYKLVELYLSWFSILIIFYAPKRGKYIVAALSVPVRPGTLSGK